MPEDSELLEIVQRLATYAVSDEVVSIVVETGEDEALMVGTKGAFLNLAKILVQGVASNDTANIMTTTADGVALQCSTSIANAFDKLGHVVPRALCIAKNAEDSKLAARSFPQS